MTTFDSRQQAFETKFAHDAEMQFKAAARRNRLFADWIADHLKLPEAERAGYRDAVVTADLQEAGDADVLRKVRGDLDKAGVDISDRALETALAECMSQAKAELADE